MASPPNLTNITPPRVPLTDDRTGLISREWYRFFLSLFTLTGSGSNTVSLTDLQVGPPAVSYEELINRIPSEFGVAPSQEALVSQIAQLQKQVNGLEMQVRPELGTMAALQQDNVPWWRFDTTPSGFPTGAAAAGTLYWDDADGLKTLNLVMEDSGGVVQQIGEETYYRIKATADITNGQVVMFTGTVGASGALKGAPATGLTAFQNEYVMGIATQDIPNNGWGYVTWFGLVRGINTTGGAEAWVDGQILYYNPAVAGGLTKNVPAAPNPKVIVASVINAATNGSLFVRPTFGSALGATDSNVQITSLSNGDFLQYIGARQRWENVAATSILVGTATNIAGGAAGSLPYQSAPDTTSMLALGTTGYVLKAGASAPAWSAPAALTKTDDTNVTLTLGGSASTALLNAASLTLGWTGQLAVGRGGTGTNTLTANGVLLGNGTSAVGATAAGTTGQVLVGNTGAAPSWSTLTSIAVTSINFGTTGLTPSAATTGAITVAGTLVAANGGTGNSTYTAGDILYASAATTLSKLGIGTANKILASTGSAPTWTSEPVLTKLNVDNIQLDVNTISTTNTNGDLVLAPNGTGTVYSDRPFKTTNQVQFSTIGTLSQVRSGTDAIASTLQLFSFTMDSSQAWSTAVVELYFACQQAYVSPGFATEVRKYVFSLVRSGSTITATTINSDSATTYSRANSNYGMTLAPAVTIVSGTVARFDLTITNSGAITVGGFNWVTQATVRATLPLIVT